MKEIAHQNDDVLQGEVELVEDSFEVADSLQNGSLKDSLSEITNVEKGKAVPRVTDLPVVGEVDTLPETFKGDSIND